jgi:lysozyme
MLNLSKTILLFVAGLTIISCQVDTKRKNDYSIQGIDVSHYQKQVDWNLVAAQNISFAFIKSTEGLEFKDTMFNKNWSSSKKANMVRGAYHFFRPTLDVKTQFENYKNHTNLMVGDMPPILDVEVYDGVSDDSLTARVQRWLTLAEDYYQVKPVLYTYQKFFNKTLQGKFNTYPLWIARYNRFFEPNLVNSEWKFWQYGNKGNLDGIEGYIDFNVFSGNLEELKEMTIQSNYEQEAIELIAP